MSARRRVTVGVAAVVGLLVAWQAEAVTRAVATVLPLAWKVRSKGTGLPAFEDAYPTILTWTVAVLAIAGVAALVVARFPARLERAAQRLRPLPLETWLIAVTALVYGWISWPHLATKSNSRIHWVDIFFEPWVSSYWYTLVKLPHMVFYDYPWLWQAINGGLNVALVMAIVRAGTGRRVLGLGAGVAFLVSGQVLLFSNTAEDVQICFSAILGLMLALQHRRPVAVGFMLWVLMLARPQFLIAVPVLVLAELVSTPGRLITRVKVNRFLAVALITFTLLFVSWHVFLNLRGTGWLLTEGQLLNVGYASVEPQEVDGFTIYPFSGSYVAHFLWLLPLSVLATVAVGLRRLDAIARPRRVVVLWALGFCGLLLASSELSPQMYFNVRYVTYGMLPILLAAFLMAPEVMRGRALQRPLAAGVLVAITLGGVAFPHQELRTRETTLAEPLIDLYPHRFRLREAARGREVYVDVDQANQRYLVSYVLKASINDQTVLDEGSSAAGPGILVTTAPQDLPNAEVLLRTESVGVYILGRPTDVPPR